MSVLMFAVLALLATTIDEAITTHAERAKMARTRLRRVKQYKFN